MYIHYLREVIVFEYVLDKKFSFFSKIISHLFIIQALSWLLKNYRSTMCSQQKCSVVFDRGFGGLPKGLLV
jgi:hypothetical protein